MEETKTSLRGYCYSNREKLLVVLGYMLVPRPVRCLSGPQLVRIVVAVTHFCIKLDTVVKMELNKWESDELDVVVR